MGNPIGPLHIERKMDGEKKGEMMMRFSGTMLVSYFHREIKKKERCAFFFNSKSHGLLILFVGCDLRVSEWPLVIIITLDQMIAYEYNHHYQIYAYIKIIYRFLVTCIFSQKLRISPPFDFLGSHFQIPLYLDFFFVWVNLPPHTSFFLAYSCSL